MGKRFDLRKNREIRSAEVRLIDENGEQLGIKKIDEALQLAQDGGFDLIEISSASSPPVCRIGDFSKFKYEREKKLKEAKKKNKVVILKEVRIRPKISPHDLDIKIKYIEGFLAEKDKVKVSVIFQGREMQHQERGGEIMNELTARFAQVADIERDSRMSGNRISMLLIPKAALKK